MVQVGFSCRTKADVNVLLPVQMFGRFSSHLVEYFTSYFVSKRISQTLVLHFQIVPTSCRVCVWLLYNPVYFCYISFMSWRPLGFWYMIFMWSTPANALYKVMNHTRKSPVWSLGILGFTWDLCASMFPRKASSSIWHMYLCQKIYITLHKYFLPLQCLLVIIRKFN